MTVDMLDQDKEIVALLESVYQYTGFDFRNYVFNSMRRRIFNILRVNNLTSVRVLQLQLLSDPDQLNHFLQAMSVPITAMFREPNLFKVLRQEVFPLMRERPSIRIWSAGCSTGEEVYSLAILLKEEGLAKKSKIYATDVNESLLSKAKEGIYPLHVMQRYTQNYLASGGNSDFSDYYTSSYGKAIFHSSLRRHIVFAHHNLVTDTSFNEFNLILCRNVLIYFNTLLQERVYNLLHESLPVGGYLALGEKESVKLSFKHKCYRQIGDKSISLFEKTKH